MCGISGYLDFDNCVNIGTLRRMTDIIKHRGPDDEGYALFGKEKIVFARGDDTQKECNISEHINNIKHSRCFLGFGHRRLSIIDLTVAGHQPMQLHEEELYITYNGEIYNYLEVREELQSLGYCFRTNTDTEIILQSYRAWGQDCVNHFNGMWAFALYDLKNQCIFCSRDRIGAKPFYYYYKGNHFVFGSEIKQLCQDDYFENKLNEKLLRITLLFHLQDFSEETLIKNIYSLPAGHNLIIKLDINNERIVKVEKRSYWDLQIPKNKKKNNNWYSYLKDGVKLRLRSDAPLGVLVSGGVDSTLLIKEICSYGKSTGEFKPEDIATFTSCYKNENIHDETYYAHLVNESCGTNEHLIYPGCDDMLSIYQKMIWHFEDAAPFSTLGSFMTLHEVSKVGVKVVINGQGGDESMLGYERYYTSYLWQSLKQTPKEFINMYKQIVNSSKLTMKQLLQYLVYFLFPKIRIIRNKWGMRKVLSATFMKDFDCQDVLELLQFKDFDKLIYNELRKTQLPHILRMDDRGYMAFSMESRVPLIDYRYLQAAVEIDPMQKIRNGYSKYLFREKMKDDIPEEVVWRKNKNGWSSPAQKWIERFDEKRVKEMLEHPISGKYFNMQYVKNAWKMKKSGRELESFFFVETFCRMFHLSV